MFEDEPPQLLGGRLNLHQVACGKVLRHESALLLAAANCNARRFYAAEGRLMKSRQPNNA
jgi:hypothetical protein